jgi:hypothetical protein
MASFAGNFHSALGSHRVVEPIGKSTVGSRADHEMLSRVPTRVIHRNGRMHIWPAPADPFLPWRIRATRGRRSEAASDGLRASFRWFEQPFDVRPRLAPGRPGGPQMASGTYRRRVASAASEPIQSRRKISSSAGGPASGTRSSSSSAIVSCQRALTFSAFMCVAVASRSSDSK